MEKRNADNSIGFALWQRRMEAGRSLEEAEYATKISRTYLHAIEQDQYEKLPGVSYIHGYLRSYARWLGVPADLAVDRYIAEQQPDETIRVKAPPLQVGQHEWTLSAISVVSIIMLCLSYSGLLFAHHQPAIVPLDAAMMVEVDDVPDMPSMPAAMHGPRQHVHCYWKIVPDTPTTSLTCPEKPELVTGIELTIQAKQWIRILQDRPAFMEPSELVLFDQIIYEGQRMQLPADASLKLVAGNAKGMDCTYQGQACQLPEHPRAVAWHVPVMELLPSQPKANAPLPWAVNVKETQ